uniref:Reverse transcriptase Ty1/copia-type domain-containing protein n=1 Tax=Tanacetum cinerariifolium TaxID=118510 RepID=A0A6L2P6S2_TANCI|nr:hypothetical protein [Tanacetum cinerariifolium]
MDQTGFLTISMNYVSVVAENQTNGIAGSKENLVAGQDDKKKELKQEYIMIPICITDPLLSQCSKDSAVDAEKKAPKVDESKASDNGGKNDQVSKSKVEGLPQEARQTENINSTKSINIVGSPVNTVGSSFVNAASQTPINVAGPSTNDTGIFGNAYDDEVLEEEVDMNNLDSSFTIPEATKFLKDHPQEQVIESLETPVQTRKMSKTHEEFGLLSSVHKLRRTNHKYFQNCLFACFLSQMEPKKPVQALQDPSWVEAMQDELLQFKLLKVWTLVDLPKDKWAIGLQVKQKRDGIFISQDKYVAEVLKKFDFVNVKTSTSRPDITFAVYACARFQVNPNTSHLHAVKRIFRYLKVQPKLGLWYPTYSPFDLESYSDSDYAGASLNRKYTTEGCQFLGKRLISWQYKKQTIIVNSTTEAEYVAAANCCGQASINTIGLILMLLSKDNQVEGMARNKEMYIISSHTKKIFANIKRIGAGFSRVIKPLFDSMMVQATTDMGDTPVETHQTPIVDQPSTSKPQKKQQPRRKQRKEAGVSHDESEDEDHVSTPFSDPLPSGEDSSILNELMVFCTNLQEHVLDLQEAKDAQAKEIDALKKKVAKLNKWRKSKFGGLRRLKKIGSGRRVKSPMEKDGLGAQEDASKHGRMIEEIDQNAEIALDDKGKDKMIKHEVPIKKNDQMRIDEEYARKLEAIEQEAGRSFDEIKELFNREMIKVNDFIAMDLEAQERNTKRIAKHIESDMSKKQKVDENVEPVIDDSKELKKCMEIVPDDGDEVLIEATPISSRSPTIIDYKIHKEGKKNYFKIIRADGNSHVYQTFEKMFKNFNREDLEVLWAIVKDRFKKEKPVDDMDNLLFKTLKPCLSIMLKIQYGNTNKD